MKWNRILGCLAVGAMFWACSDNDGKDVVGGASGDAGVVAVKDWEVAGVSQKGPFVTGSAVTVQELDGITLKQTGKSFKGSIKSDKGDFAIKDINLESQYAILEASGYYRDEISGKKSSGTVTLRALTDLSNRKTVNINLLTHLEYERVMYLVTEKKKSIAEAKAQAEKEILASFGIDGDYAESEDLNIFESGDGNAALLAVSVLMQSDVDVAGLTERMGEFSIALAEGGSWDDADTKTAIADWACDVDLKGTIANVRKNIENWKYADTVPAFEKFVTNFWWNNYGLGVCNEKRKNETKRNVNKLSKLYNEYFVCEKGRWVIPEDKKSSSSSKDGDSEAAMTSSSSSVTLSGVEGSSSSIVSSSSIYNPFVDPNPIGIPDSAPLPVEVQVFDTTYRFENYEKLGDGKQEVWFFKARTYSTADAEEKRDSIATNLVNVLGIKGFSYDGIEMVETHENGYSDTCYVYSLKKDGVVYKVSIRKIKDGYKELPIIIIWFGFEVKVVVLKDGFKELPVDAPRSSSSSAVSSSSYFDPFTIQSSSSSVVQKKDSLPDLPEQLAFVEKYLERKTEYTEYADGKQIVWRGESPTYSIGMNVLVVAWDSAGSALVSEAVENGFEYTGSYPNDSLDNDFTNDSHVYSKTSNGKVWTVVITKGAVRSGALGVYTLSQFFVKMIVRDLGFDEIPTELRKDYSSPKYRDLPEDLKFIREAFSWPNRESRNYSNDSLWTLWTFSSLLDTDGMDSLPEAKAKADEYATMMETHGFFLKSKESYSMKELESMGYAYFGTAFSSHGHDNDIATLYRFEKEVEGFLYKADVYASYNYCSGNMAWFETRANIRITIYDK